MTSLPMQTSKEKRPIGLINKPINPTGSANDPSSFTLPPGSFLK